MDYTDIISNLTKFEKQKKITIDYNNTRIYLLICICFNTENCYLNCLYLSDENIVYQIKRKL